MPKLTLALFHDAARTGDVLAWINRFDRGSANNTVSWTDRVIHAGAERCSGRAQLHCLTLSDRGARAQHHRRLVRSEAYLLPPTPYEIAPRRRSAVIGRMMSP